jgi:uncharacterized SAM-binding protein YcdF (DUF218 family)
MQLMQFIKELVATATAPLACGFILAVAGAIVRLFGSRRIAAGLWLVAASLVYLSAIAPVADSLLMPLEGRYPPLSDMRSLPPVGYIVVLGSSYAPRDGIPITAALEGDGLARIAEGVRLMRLIGGARLVVSGGALDPQVASAIGYAKFAADFGVDEGSIVKLEQPLDTAEEAGRVAALIGKAPFILVTSAYHMPRAVRLMELAGARPIPAPTGQLAPLRLDFGVRSWIPRVASLRKTERAIHEYMGMAIVN